MNNKTGSRAEALRRLTFALAALIVLAGQQASAATNGLSVDHSKGVVLLGSPAGAATCKAAITGAIRYNSTNPGLQYCDGTNWQAAGGMALISTQTASNSASLQWTGLGSYNNYYLNCSVITPASNAVNFEAQVGEGATPTWETATYNGSGYASDQTGATSIIGPTSGGSGLIVAGNVVITATNNYSLSLQLWLTNVQSTTVAKHMQFLSEWNIATNPYFDTSGSGGGTYNGDGNAVTAFRVLFSSGNISTGQCSLYGMN